MKSNVCEKAEWEKILPRIQGMIQDEGLDNDPPKLAEIVAKIAKAQTADGKGIIFLGSVGSGKTRRAEFIANLCDINFISADRIGAIWMECGGDVEFFKEAIYADNSYRKYNYVPPFMNDLIIDDMGIEEKQYQCYGNTLDVMKELIYLRYNVFPKWRTFFTTNLSKEDLLERYGERCFSRLCEMCGFVPLTHPDRRRKK